MFSKSSFLLYVLAVLTSIITTLPPVAFFCDASSVGDQQQQQQDNDNNNFINCTSFFKNPTACSNSSNNNNLCYYNPKTFQCIKKCFARASREECDGGGDGLCSMSLTPPSPTLCRPACKTIKDEIDCALNTQCTPIMSKTPAATGGKEEVSLFLRCADAMCPSGTDSAACNSDPLCYVKQPSSGQTEATCAPRPCSSVVSKEACLSNSKACVWLADQCQDIFCDLNLPALSCMIRQACYYNQGYCFRKPCYAPTENLCAKQEDCVWDKLKNGCALRPRDCQYTPWSWWSPCSSICRGFSTRSRSILHQPLPGGSPCDHTLLETRSCGIGLSCVVDCAQLGEHLSCVTAVSDYGLKCVWNNNRCQVPVASPCSWFPNPSLCNGAAHGCSWLDGRCVPEASQCSDAISQSQCEAQPSCSWTNQSTTHNNNNSNKVLFYNIGEHKAIFPFEYVTLTSPQNAYFDSLTISIQNGYQQYYDVLSSNFSCVACSIPRFQNASFNSQQGLLTFSGFGTTQVYTQLLRSVKFATTRFAGSSSSSSGTKEPKVITYVLTPASNFGGSSFPVYYKGDTNNKNNTNNNNTNDDDDNNDRIYSFVPLFGRTQQEASALCSASGGGGGQGKLAVPRTQGQMLAIRYLVTGSGWIGISGQPGGVWTELDNTSQVLWAGGSPQIGGHPVNNRYTNWHSGGSYSNVFPRVRSNASGVILLPGDGSWKNIDSNSRFVPGFVCEYPTSSSSQQQQQQMMPVASTGHVEIRAAGCNPTSATTCAYHTTFSCPPSCRVVNAQCVDSCRPNSIWNCEKQIGCRLSSSSPPACVEDICASQSFPMCNGPCKVLGNKCVRKTGCSAFLTEITCRIDMNCKWDSSSTRCENNKPCLALFGSSCLLSPSSNCKLIDKTNAALPVPASANSSNSICVEAEMCSSCAVSSHACSFVNPSSSQFGHVSFIVGSPPKTVFSKASVTFAKLAPGASGFVAAITSGYRRGQDRLSLMLSDPTATAMMNITWCERTGTLTVSPKTAIPKNTLLANATLSGLSDAAQSVMFGTSSADTKRKVHVTLSYTYGFKPQERNVARVPIPDSSSPLSNNGQMLFIGRVVENNKELTKLTYEEAKQKCQSLSYLGEPTQLVEINSAAVQPAIILQLLSTFSSQEIERIWLGALGFTYQQQDLLDSHARQMLGGGENFTRSFGSLSRFYWESDIATTSKQEGNTPQFFFEGDSTFAQRPSSSSSFYSSFFATEEPVGTQTLPPLYLNKSSPSSVFADNNKKNNWFLRIALDPSTGNWYSATSLQKQMSNYFVCQSKPKSWSPSSSGGGSSKDSAVSIIEFAGCLPRSCVARTEAECVSSDRHGAQQDCMWTPATTASPGKCQMTACISHSNAETCNAQSKNCFWSPLENLCRLKRTNNNNTYGGGSFCAGFPDSLSCNFNTNCAWVATANYSICVSRLCLQHTSAYSCRGDRWCKWNQFNNELCLPQDLCLEHNTASSCTAASSSKCIWNSNLWPSCFTEPPRPSTTTTTSTTTTSTSTSTSVTSTTYPTTNTPGSTDLPSSTTISTSSTNANHITTKTSTTTTTSTTATAGALSTNAPSNSTGSPSTTSTTTTPITPTSTIIVTFSPSVTSGTTISSVVQEAVSTSSLKAALQDAIAKDVSAFLSSSGISVNGVSSSDCYINTTSAISCKIELADTDKLKTQSAVKKLELIADPGSNSNQGWMSRTKNFFTGQVSSFVSGVHLDSAFASSSNSAPTSPTTNSPPSSKNNNALYYIIGGLGALVVVLAVAAIIFRNRANNNRQSTTHSDFSVAGDVEALSGYGNPDT